MSDKPSTEKGRRTRARILSAALKRVSEDGYDGATMRAIAEDAEVSLGLMYRYFPGKEAFVVALYDDLSLQFADVAPAALEAKDWEEAFFDLVEASLATLKDHRGTLKQLFNVFFSEGQEALYPGSNRFSQERVQGVFHQLAHRAKLPGDADSWGKSLHVTHLFFVLFWLIDRSPEQAATYALIKKGRETAPMLRALLAFPGVAPTITSVFETAQAAVLAEQPSAADPKGPPEGAADEDE